MKRVQILLSGCGIQNGILVGAISIGPILRRVPILHKSLKKRPELDDLIGIQDVPSGQEKNIPEFRLRYLKNRFE